MKTFKEFLTENNMEIHDPKFLNTQTEIQDWIDNHLSIAFKWEVTGPLVSANTINIYDSTLTQDPKSHLHFLPFRFGECDTFTIHSRILNSLKGSPLAVSACYTVNNNDFITTLDDITPKCAKFDLKGLQAVYSFKDIHRHIKETLILDTPNSIKSSILGILLIKSLQVLHVNNPKFADAREAFDIVKKHLRNEKDVLSCQEELIGAGLKEYARL